MIRYIDPYCICNRFQPAITRISDLLRVILLLGQLLFLLFYTFCSLAVVWSDRRIGQIHINLL
jgi:hypothetical protein